MVMMVTFSEGNKLMIFFLRSTSRSMICGRILPPCKYESITIPTSIISCERCHGMVAIIQQQINKLTFDITKLLFSFFSSTCQTRTMIDI